MAEVTTRIPRPQRWDVPFDAAMTEAEVDRLLAFAPYAAIDPARFPPTIPLRGILHNDARVRRFEAGDIIVREGDYGSSAFFVLQGAVRVVLDSLPSAVLGRRPPQKKSFTASLAQLWSRPAYPEVRDYTGGKTTRGTEAATVSARRAAGDEVRVFLQDVPRRAGEKPHRAPRPR